MYSYGLIGNCNISAFVSGSGALEWLCLPKPDSEPVFGKILDPEGGSFSIFFSSGQKSKFNQYYLENTNVLVTECYSDDGSAYKITDFCPRYEQHGRLFRPLALFRIVEPIKNAPHIEVRCSPVEGWNKKQARANRGSSHLRYEFRNGILRLSTNMSLTFLSESVGFSLREKMYFAMTWDTAIEEDLSSLIEMSLKQTIEYWQRWVKHCSIPTLFQKETIRSALALKLHCYEDTGAILAALTTSLPEDVSAGRNWDYRFCWIRDAYFVLSAFHNLGHFEEMEGFLKFLLGIAHTHEKDELRVRPVYALNNELPLPEAIHENWAGYANSKPVRTFNQAAEHIQNDVYGEMALTLSPIFCDDRFYHLRTKNHEDLLSWIAKLCVEHIGDKDAGLWEVRRELQEHSFTNLMLWAGLDRIRSVKNKGYLKDLQIDLDSSLEKAKQRVLSAVVDGSLRNGPKDKSFDSSLVLMRVLRFPDEKICQKTLEDAQSALKFKGEHDGFFYRYTRPDDFGSPQSAFMICSFWYAQAHAMSGNKQEAKRILDQTLKAATPLGLISEHFLPSEKMQLGNFPQAYSHVGLINAAFAVSPPWCDFL